MSVDSRLKYAIANAIFSDPEHKPFNFSEIDGNEHGVILSIDFQRVNSLSTQIKVKTKTNGTHYYTLSMKEDY